MSKKNTYSGFRYDPSDSVKRKKEEYEAYLNGENAFSFSDSERLENAKNAYYSAPDFNYNLASDPLYRYYANGYAEQGRRAMLDTIGKATEGSGGYSNSYAMAAGNRAYNDHLYKMNDIIPELQRAAYDKYKGKLQTLEARLHSLESAEKSEYDRYKDIMAAKEKAYSDAYERDYESQKASWESDFKASEALREQSNQSIAQSIASREASVAESKLLLEQQKQSYAERKKYGLSDIQIAAILKTRGKYTALTALDYTYGGDEKAIRYKGMALGIPLFYINAYLGGRWGLYFDSNDPNKRK